MSCRKDSSICSTYCSVFSIAIQLTGVTVCLDISGAFDCFKAVYLLPYNTINTAHNKTANARNRQFTLKALFPSPVARRTVRHSVGSVLVRG